MSPCWCTSKNTLFVLYYSNHNVSYDGTAGLRKAKDVSQMVFRFHPHYLNCSIYKHLCASRQIGKWQLGLLKSCSLLSESTCSWMCHIDGIQCAFAVDLGHVNAWFQAPIMSTCRTHSNMLTVHLIYRPHAPVPYVNATGNQGHSSKLVFFKWCTGVQCRRVYLYTFTRNRIHGKRWPSVHSVIIKGICALFICPCGKHRSPTWELLLAMFAQMYG